MTDLDADLARAVDERLATRLAESSRVRDGRRRRLAELSERRRFGLQARHRRKLNNQATTEGNPMAGDTVVTVCGNLVEDPNLRFTPSGQAVATFRIASTPRFYDRDSGQWKDGDALFLTCNVWRQAAENVAESLQRGMRVIVQGRLKQRSYETREGEKRTVYEVEVDEVGPSLRSAVAKVHKAQRDKPGQPSQPQPNQPADPWSNQGDQPPF